MPPLQSNPEAAILRLQNAEAKFDRQRRNLVLSWAVLFFYQTAGPQLDRVVVPVAQFSLHLQRPDVVVFWLWGLLVYFLIRYHQFFNAYVINLVGRDVRDVLLKLTEKRAIEKAILVMGNKHPELAVKGLRVAVEASNTTPTERSYKTGAVHFREGDRWIAKQSESIQIAVGGWDYWWIKQKALLIVSWERPFFTEYWMPFFLPFVCVLWALVAYLVF